MIPPVGSIITLTKKGAENLRYFENARFIVTGHALQIKGQKVTFEDVDGATVILGTYSGFKAKVISENKLEFENYFLDGEWELEKITRNVVVSNILRGEEIKKEDFDSVFALDSKQEM